VLAADAPPDAAADAAAAPGRPAWRRELGTMLRLALPVIGVQVGLMLMGVVDVVMVGRVSATALAAVALGNIVFFGVAQFGLGTLMAIDPLVSQAVGAGDRGAVASAVQRGVALALLAAPPLALVMWPAEWVFARTGQPAGVVPVAGAFVRASVAGLPPYLLFGVVRQALQAMHRTRAIVAAIVAGNLANLALNLAFVRGRWGAPALGAVGSAWSSTGSRWLMAVVLVAAAWPALRPALRPWRPGAFGARALLPLARLGAPIGVQQCLEFFAFGLTGLLMGRLGTVPMAGHETALNLAALVFMVPLGVGAAAAVRVGHAVGRGDAPGARRAAGLATLVGVGFMAATAALMLSAPRLLAGLYTTDAAVLAAAAALIPLAGVFQVFDGLQVVSLGVLRGVGDTRAPVAINLVGFWLVGLPLGCWLCFGRGMGARGLWWGLVAGLATVAVVLALRVRRQLAGRLARTVA
jgi:MATE family multidrug resistance protein